MALDINRNVISRNKQEPIETYFSWNSYFTMAEKLTADTLTEEATSPPNVLSQITQPEKDWHKYRQSEPPVLPSLRAPSYVT
ncbi:Threonine synthase [Dissostichus eleginoides]|uniref:Threonine synthase n=1 Tax=Dissostichus eleginoides TaxID=100907 RepID=A0AAD9F7X1_DISEL|nr:Threonine synthase [Dissostichus eleginoides]